MTLPCEVVPAESETAKAHRLKAAARTNREHAEEIRANDPDGAFRWMMQADQQEDEAEALLALHATPVIGRGGEIVPTSEGGSYVESMMKSKRLTAVNVQASIERTELLDKAKAFDLGTDAAESFKAKDAFEQMATHQLAAAHKHAMKLFQLADEQVNPVEKARMYNTAARLMGVFQDGVLTLQRKRNGGRQTVIVQHVQVNEGAQAVIGNVTPGGGRRGGRKPKQ